MLDGVIAAPLLGGSLGDAAMADGMGMTHVCRIGFLNEVVRFERAAVFADDAGRPGAIGQPGREGAEAQLSEGQCSSVRRGVRLPLTACGSVRQARVEARFATTGFIFGTSVTWVRCVA